MSAPLSPAFLFDPAPCGHRSFTIPPYGESRLEHVLFRCVVLRWVELALRTELSFLRVRRRVMLVAAGTLAGSLALMPGSVSAEGLLDLFFGGGHKQQARQAPPQASFFADPIGINQLQQEPATAHCVAGS